MSITSKNKPFKKIDKSLGIRLVEFTRALHIIKTSLDGLRKGHEECVIPLSGQLRALLLDRDPRSKALLFTLATELNTSIKIHHMPDSKDSAINKILEGKESISMGGFPLTIEKELVNQEECLLKDFLQKKVINYKGKLYSSSDIITWHANFAGGAHYSKEIPEDFFYLQLTSQYGIDMLQTVLAYIGTTTLQAGIRILKDLVEFELHSIIAIPTLQKVDKINFLYDHKCKHSPMRTSIICDDEFQLSFSISGYQGITQTIKTNGELDWNSPNYITAVHRISDDLESILELFINGALITADKQRTPHIIPINSLSFSKYYNRAVNGSIQNFSFGIASWLRHGRKVSNTEREQIYDHFKNTLQDSKLELIVFHPHSYGILDTKANIKITGKVTHEQDHSNLPNVF